MTKQQIINGVERAVAEGNDIQVCSAVEWLMDYGLIDWKIRNLIYDTITRARDVKEEEKC